jgi:hypothetical protein
MKNLLNTFNSIRPSASKVGYIFIILFMVSSYNLWRTWLGHGKTPFYSDVNVYYSYLPALFVHNDLTFSFPNEYWTVKAENGNTVMKSSMGMAYMYMPFFLIGHSIALVTGEAATGYSQPYAWSVYYGTLIYMFVGLYFLRKALKRYFSEGVTALTLIAVYLGTNLMFYNLGTGEMTHGYLFAIYGVLIYKLIRWNDTGEARHLYVIAFLSGLALAIRSVELFTLLIIPFFGVYNKETLNKRLQQLFGSVPSLVLVLFCLILPLIPQVIYWKIITGQWFFYSYPGEKFFFDNPKLLDFLFSYRKGWFLYTPMMLLAVAGLFYLKKFVKDFSYILPIILIITVYVLSSWWTWWYGGGFGMRAMIQFYAFMAFPLAALFQQFNNSLLKRSTRNFFVTVLIVLSLFQSYQYKIAFIHWDSMSKDTYWLIFGKLRLAPEELEAYQHMIDPPDYDKAKAGIR